MDAIIVTTTHFSHLFKKGSKELLSQAESSLPNLGISTSIFGYIESRPHPEALKENGPKKWKRRGRVGHGKC